jgi:hypothetical protein
MSNPKVRALLGFVSAAMAGNLGLWALNMSTRSHPIGRVTQISGILTFLVAVAAVYGVVRYGWRDALVRITVIVAAFCALGAWLHWLPLVPLLSAFGIAGTLLFALCRPGGARRIAVLVATILIAAFGFVLTLAFAAAVVQCDPKRRWVCNLAGLGLMGLMVLAECSAYARSRKLMLRSGPTS